MRRKDREVTDNSEILKIIDKCDSLTIALLDEGKPYLLPMNFGYEYVDNKLVLYFHSAKEGKKLDLINVNHNAWFSMDCSHSLITAEFPCAYTMLYESVIGSGQIQMINEFNEKAKALKLIMKKYDASKEYEFEQRHTNAIAVLRLDVEQYTAKRSAKK